ncbi:T-cell-specific surface glycoprotein CD28-like [Oncorhynchus keta]|uniref:T-cell-specific surface glycoprotein CD28-like n=1 Tax=Oncorhynchus keta TaxID=8018 RepID=UPI00227B4DFC|nr:T-cell-specific surface glycoprotein CD28-like [Oncorhynchus keta]
MEGNLWMTTILLSFSLSDNLFTELSQRPDCNDRPLSIQSVSLHSRVSISCPNMTGDDLRFHLSLNRSLVHTTVLKRNQNHTRNNQSDTWVQFYPAEQNLNHNLTNRYVFTVNGTGLYICRAERLWSPPYKVDSVHTLLITKKQCLKPHDPLAKQSCVEDPNPLLLCLLLVGCGVLLLYSTILTVIVVLIWRKLKKEVSAQSTYLNIKLGEKRVPQRVQYPVTGRF